MRKYDWKLDMYGKGDTWRSYHICKECKPYCSLADFYCENAFTRRKNWYPKRFAKAYKPRFVKWREGTVPYREQRHFKLQTRLTDTVKW